MKYQEMKGDLFDVDRNKWVLAHCISADVTKEKNMNKGIAKIFRNFYPKMAEKISQKLEVGKAVKYQESGHTIYNLVTKHKVWQKAKGDYEENYYRQLFHTLKNMRDQMISEGEQFLAMPKIASGLDGGNWNKISRTIKEVFAETNITIQINFL
ncbi:MAG: hypothetical protein ACFFBP_02740 [Promethearchaeota archaeon]